MTAAARIGVAGLGIVSPLGDDLEAAWRRLCAGGSAVARLALEGLPALAAARVETDVAAEMTKLQRVGVDRVAQLALAATRRALADAGMPAQPGDPERVGVYFGVGMGGADSIDAGYAALHAGRRMPPLTVPAGMVNGAAAVVAMHTQARGPVLTYAVACASSAVAVIEAAHALRRGEIDVAIAGGAEAILARGTAAAWQSLGALAAPDDADPARSCRPFSPDRRGLALGEGAAVLVLQREAALARAPRAWLLGGAARADARHMTQPQVRGQVAALAAALRSAGLRPAEVLHCNAHGTATPAGDPAECESLRQVWAEDAPRLQVSATKAAHGHLLGAAGALEAAWTVRALQTRILPPTAGVHEIDPACAGLAHVLGPARAHERLRHAVSSSFAFGGTNAALVFGRA